MRSLFLALGLLALAAGPLAAQAQDRDTKVRNDRKTFENSKDWIYNNLDEGIKAAKAAGKPMLVAFRCIPCEACQEFDDDVARRDPIIRDLMDDFVCVRIVQANNMDLTHFQFDFDESFTIFLMNPDYTIYGRFITRSERPEYEDISLKGLRKAMEAALKMHRDYAAVKPLLAGKQVDPSPRFKTPLDYPDMAARYRTGLDYEGSVARSCMHCHQVRDAERRLVRAEQKTLPDKVLFPYPDPAVLGLKLDPEEMARVERVAPGSVADRAGIKKGDDIVSAERQPLLSIADLQWVLHNRPDAGQLKATIRHDGQTRDVTLDLPEGWRHGNIAWRTSSWELRRMAFGGMFLVELTDQERREAGIPADRLALRARHVGEFGEHARAKRAGIVKGDIIVAYDGRDARSTESELLAYALQKKRPGDEVAITILRDGKRHTMKIVVN